MQSSPFLPSTAPVLPGRLTRCNRNHSLHAALTRTNLLASRRLASTRSFATKSPNASNPISFSLVPAPRPLTRSAHDPQPWHLPFRHSLPRNCWPSLYRFRPCISSPDRTRLSINGFPWLGHCKIEQKQGRAPCPWCIVRSIRPHLTHLHCSRPIDVHWICLPALPCHAPEDLHTLFLAAAPPDEKTGVSVFLSVRPCTRVVCTETVRGTVPSSSAESHSWSTLRAYAHTHD